MKDRIDDRDLIIQEHQAKVNLLKDENKILKESQENF